MKTETLEISTDCKFEATSIEGYSTDVVLEYIEYATDHYHSDHRTSIDINKEEAQKIVDFLVKHFNLNKE